MEIRMDIINCIGLLKDPIGKIKVSLIFDSKDGKSFLVKDKKDLFNLIEYGSLDGFYV